MLKSCLCSTGTNRRVIMSWLIKAIVRLAPFPFLIASLSAIGWDVMVKSEDDKEVDGLIIGKTEFVNRYKTESRIEEGKDACKD